MAAPQRADVVVVGAGIAGLTAAIALDRVGVGVQIIERASALTQAGTALSLWPIAAIGRAEPVGTVRAWSGREILRLDQGRLHQQLGTPTLIVHRGHLQRVLLDAVSHLPISLDTTVRRVATFEGEGAVELSTGERLRAPIVLACDGVRSVSRAATGNPWPRYRGRTSWRAVLDNASQLVPEACLSAGQGKQFIVSPMQGHLTYWAADVAMPEGANQALADKKRFLLDSFAGWHHPITELIERTDEDQLVIADVYDAVPTVLTTGRVALLGDAAHPMTPDLGQGACQGIEDGVVFASCLADGADPDVALADYQASRLRRVRSMVRESRRLGALATSDSRMLMALRNSGVAHMPRWLNRRLVARYASESAFLKTLPAMKRTALPSSSGAGP
jgi:2-polyprenyl-6-methoxyphenol hydroxylase-like FAD-dependent oxidoreductase